MFHSKASLGARHPVPNWEYADATARTAATGFVAGDVGKFAWQQDNDSFWVLTNHSPITWISLGGVHAHGDLTGVTEDQHHARQHALGAAADHTSATLAQLNALVSDATLDDSGDSRDPNAHTLGGAAHSADTLANLNSKVSDATLDDSGDPRDPNVHGSAAHTGTIGAHSQLSGVGADDHHAHANKAQLDLVTDGDHDVRTDNPHSVTAAQAGAAVVTSTAPVNVTKATAAVGTSGEAARQDHKHDITTAIAAAQVPGDSAIEGSASSLARSDHKHSLPAYGTGSGTFCQGNDSRLSDARTPTSHATSHQSGGGDAVKLDDLAAPDDNTDLNATTSAHGLLPKLGGGTTNYLRADGSWAAPPGGGTSYKEYLFQADQMESPNSGDWPDSDMATLAPSPTGDAILIRRFDDTSDEGVGFTVHVPSGAVNIIFDFLSQAVTAPASAKVVKLDLYERGFPDNAAVDSWPGSGYNLSDISIPTNSNFQEDSQTIALSTLGLTANRMYQFELEREAGDAGDTLVGDWGLHSIRVRFS